MSTIMRERDVRAGHEDGDAAGARGAATSGQPATRPWPTPSRAPSVAPSRLPSRAPNQQALAAQQRPLSVAMPAPGTRERRGLLSAGLVFWLVIYTLLNVGDLLSTYLGLQAGLHEANPLMSGLLAQSGFGALIAYKLVVVVAVIAGAITLYRMHPRAAYLTVHICNTLVFLAVFLNVAQMVLR